MYQALAPDPPPAAPADFISGPCCAGAVPHEHAREHPNGAAAIVGPLTQPSAAGSIAMHSGWAQECGSDAGSRDPRIEARSVPKHGPIAVPHGRLAEVEIPRPEPLVELHTPDLKHAEPPAPAEEPVDAAPSYAETAAAPRLRLVRVQTAAADAPALRAPGLRQAGPPAAISRPAEVAGVSACEKPAVPHAPLHPVQNAATLPAAPWALTESTPATAGDKPKPAAVRLELVRAEVPKRAMPEAARNLEDPGSGASEGDPIAALAGPQGLALRPYQGRTQLSGKIRWRTGETALRQPGVRLPARTVRLTDLTPPKFRSNRNDGRQRQRLRRFRWRALDALEVGSFREMLPAPRLVGVLAGFALIAAAVLFARPGARLVKSVRWEGPSIRQAIASRAARTFGDDFQAGLSNWEGLGKAWKASWSHNREGYIRAGQLALYRPSLRLADYRLEFMAQIENKGMSWAVRARDTSNYYVVKFLETGTGPRPLLTIVRYSVIAGRKGDPVETPLRVMVHANRPYRVSLDVKGNQFRVSIEGQPADVWTQDDLLTGGVGFFSDGGERARVYWMKLASNDDFLGKVCALLTGQNGSEGAQAEKTTDEHLEFSHGSDRRYQPFSGIGAGSERVHPAAGRPRGADPVESGLPAYGGQA